MGSTFLLVLKMAAGKRFEVDQYGNRVRAAPGSQGKCDRFPVGRYSHAGEKGKGKGGWDNAQGANGWQNYKGHERSQRLTGEAAGSADSEGSRAEGQRGGPPPTE